MRTARSLLPATLASLSLVLALTGCVTTPTRGPSGSPLPDLAKGNWQISSSAPAAAGLSSISGTLSGNSAALTAILHAQTSKACGSAETPFKLTGGANAAGDVTLTGPLSGGIVTVTGSLSADGSSLSNASYNVAGGSCGFAKAAVATAQAYMPLSGSYTGSFRDADGQVASVGAALNQSADANGDGNYTLSGTAAPNNPCFAASVPISSTAVTGGTFSFTYTDPQTANSVTASGTFSPDASSLNVTGWTSSGPCGADSGTGTMTRQ